ncbi:hypothetical protein FZC80_21195 [Rossellomorea aquimaris]|uniref:Uncharacterized protein n=1 Tax=Rossellomorea aquimaris TaxID=189382 RepID=A0A5D4TA35_9BACI|nr:hypothetical protein FZC80_21195 [Rossellomorea aquimaris]
MERKGGYSCGISWRLVPAPSASGSNNLKRIKGKIAFFSLENICLSGLTKTLPLLMTGETPQAKPRRLTASPAE